MRKAPEENAPFQEHVDWILYAYWEKPIVLPLMHFITTTLLYVIDRLTSFATRFIEPSPDSSYFDDEIYDEVTVFIDDEELDRK